jgi:TonB family protein
LLPPGSAALTPRTPSLSDLQKPSKFNSYKIDTRFKLPKLPSAINEPTGTKQSKLPSAINEPTGTKQPKLPSVINEPIGTRQSNNSRTSIASTRIEQFPQRQVPRNPPLTQLPPVKPSSLRSFEGDSIPPLVNNPNLGLGQPSLPIQMPGPLPPPPPEFPISSNTPRLQPLAQPSTTTPTTLAMGTSSSVATAPPPTTTPRTAPTGTSSPVVTAAPQINVRDNTDNSSASVYNPYNKQITQWLTAQNLTNTDLETVRRLPPMYGNCPPQACSAGVKNEVVVAVRVDDKGKIISDDVLGSSDSGKFDAEAHSTIRRYQFPATGKVEAYLVPVHFQNNSAAPAPLTGSQTLPKPPVVENRTSTDKPPVVENRTSTDKPPVVENRTSSIKPPVVENRTSSIKPPVVENRTSSIKPPAVENRTSADKPANSENRTSADKPANSENRTSADKPANSENRTSADKLPSSREARRPTSSDTSAQNFIDKLRRDFRVKPSQSLTETPRTNSTDKPSQSSTETPRSNSTDKPSQSSTETPRSNSTDKPSQSSTETPRTSSTEPRN